MPDQPTYIEETQELVSLALKEAKLMVQYGTTSQKTQIVKSVLGVLARQAAAGQDAAANEMRVKMEALMLSMRTVPELDVVTVGEEDFIDAVIVEDDE
jgi:hypothetical protein